MITERGIIVHPEYAFDLVDIHDDPSIVVLSPSNLPKMDITQSFRVALTYGLANEELNAPWYAGSVLGRCKYNKARIERAKARNRKRKQKCKR